MLVVLPEGSERFQPLVDVLDQATLVVIDVNSGSNVHGGDQNQSVSDSRLFEGTLDLRRQVNVRSLRLRVQGQVFGVEFHASTFTTLSRVPRPSSAWAGSFPPQFISTTNDIM